MAAKSWVSRIEDIVEPISSFRRPELKSSLLKTISENKRQVENYARNNVSLYWGPESNDRYENIKGLPFISIDAPFYKKLVAAIYLANSEYFGRRAIKKEERLVLNMLAQKWNFIHKDSEYLFHINVPFFRDLHNNKKLSSTIDTIDSETRHAVHAGKQADIGYSLNHTAGRGAHLIGEFIDVGNLSGFEDWGSGAVHDPYLNDFTYTSDFTTPKEERYWGATWLGMYMSKDPEEKRKQFCWLSGIPLRKRCDNTDAIEKISAMEQSLRSYDIGSVDYDEPSSIAVEHEDEKCRILSFDDETGRTKKSGDSTLQAGKHFLMTPAYITEIYQFGNITSDIDCPEEAIKTIVEARQFAIDNIPYEVPETKAFRIGGKSFTKFASMLDYAVLKLAYSAPDALFAEEMTGQQQMLNI